MKYKEQYDKFLNAWGEKAQITMCLEEMSELTKELCKFIRYENNPEKLAEIKPNLIQEIADVLNTAEQMQYIFGEKEVDEQREYKIQRTLKKLEENK